MEVRHSYCVDWFGTVIRVVHVLHLPTCTRRCQLCDLDLAVRRTVFLLHARILLEAVHVRRSGEPVRGIRRSAV